MSKNSTKKKSVAGKIFDYRLLKRILSYVKPYKNIFVWSMIATTLLAFVSPIRPMLIEYMLDHYVVTPHADKLLTATCFLIGLLFLEGILQFLSTYSTNWLGQTIIKDLRSNLYNHIIGLRLKYFDQTPIGTLVTRVVSDIETISDIFSQGLIIIMGDVLKILVIILVMFSKNIGLTFVCLLPIPILLVATYWFKNSVNNSFQDVRTQIARLNAFVQEHITGMAIVQIFNKEEAELNKFEAINNQHKKANIRSILAYSIFFPVVEILSSLSLALIVWWAGKGILQHTTSVGELVEFILFTSMLFRPIRMLADRFNTLQMGMVSSERVFQVFDANVAMEDSGKIHEKNMLGNIEFKNVWFAYNDENWVLKNISFTAKVGEKIALVGATGAGKSSTINILTRFYELNKGEILIDGINIKEYTVQNLNRNIAVVLQDVFLFSNSILNNISLNNPAITREQIIEASKIVGAHDFISRLPGGYDYNVMERGAMLSVGQRQLISFIRAYVYNPKILILDEATSSIDTESEKLIQYATDKVTQNRTSIIIAHRLATIQKADKIIVMDHGKIIESGNHQELLKQNGQYKKLFDLQFKNEAVISM
ncbi:MAG: ABC transporter ATP-binding protein [Bacteroidia bacterium]